VAVEAIVSARGVIFTEPVEVRDQYTGCVRFSYLAPGSVTPARYRCLPSPPPIFTSTHFGDPSYAQLGINCPRAFRYGNDDGNEVGVGHVLRPLVRRELLDDTIAEFAGRSPRSRRTKPLDSSTVLRSRSKPGFVRSKAARTGSARKNPPDQC
jgi:hypothetical protein